MLLFPSSIKRQNEFPGCESNELVDEGEGPSFDNLCETSLHVSGYFSRYQVKYRCSLPAAMSSGTKTSIILGDVISQNLLLFSVHFSKLYFVFFKYIFSFYISIPRPWFSLGSGVSSWPKVHSDLGFPLSCEITCHGNSR